MARLMDHTGIIVNIAIWRRLLKECVLYCCSKLNEFGKIRSN